MLKERIAEFIACDDGPEFTEQERQVLRLLRYYKVQSGLFSRMAMIAHDVHDRMVEIAEIAEAHEKVQKFWWDDFKPVAEHFGVSEKRLHELVEYMDENEQNF